MKLTNFEEVNRLQRQLSDLRFRLACIGPEPTDVLRPNKLTVMYDGQYYEIDKTVAKEGFETIIGALCKMTQRAIDITEEALKALGVEIDTKEPGE